MAVMANCDVLYFFSVFGIFSKGLTAVIQTQQTVMAAVEGEAHLNCRLLQSRDVFQIKWLKNSPEVDKILTINDKYYQSVNPDFEDKMQFTDVGLQDSSIVIRNVTEQDGGCYHCLFVTYPDGALTGRTCLQVYELHQPVLHVRESNCTEQSVVSCSVTGRPAPTVTLSVTQQDLDFSNYNTTSVNNTNGSVTVTTTAVLSGFCNNIHVGCAGRVLSGPQTEVFVMIPEVKPTSADGSDEESGSGGFRRTHIVIPMVVLTCVCVSVFIAVLLRRRAQSRLSHRDSDMNEMPPIKSKDSPRTETPLVRQEGTELRRRTPPEDDQRSINMLPSPPITGILNFDQ